MDSEFKIAGSDAATPLISCLMPTYNRRAFVLQAIRYFLRQDWPNRELIVIDDGEDAVGDLMPAAELLPAGVAVRYYRLEKKITLGAKLNLACGYARGPLIAHWDDDDWYAPWRLRYQTEALRAAGTMLCGINRLLYYDFAKRKGLEYIYPSDQRVWLIGSSLFYWRELWVKQSFADINVGMDGLFVWAAPPAQVTVLADNRYAVHLIHAANVSPKRTEGRWWHPFEVGEIKEILGEDWGFYDRGAAAPVLLGAGESGTALSGVGGARRWRNVFACLVHERADCIQDLVRNLHRHDQGSVILLYNGGGDGALLGKDFPYADYNAIVYPNPSPVKWGYLHRFALDCMDYAVRELAFDSLTIVDSDQLCVRSGYSEYLGGFLAGAKGVGMLSCMPERVTKDHIKMHVALQAFKEYELWKPLLQGFPDGEEKFVHWTFWPSTVFLAPACADLVRVFRENELLVSIMTKTKIWATEEVILPLLVRLLGYEIVANPCAYDIVRFRKPILKEELRAGFSRPNVYWAHPVRRVYDDPIRVFIRQRAAMGAGVVAGAEGPGAVVGTKMRGSTMPRPEVEVLMPGPVRETRDAAVAAPVLRQVAKSRPVASPSLAGLLPRLRKIGGWLSDGEANLLADITLRACGDAGRSHQIVEIGSYHGKSTVLFASLIKSFGLRGTVHAIDVHDGRLGAADQGLKTYPPSFTIFNHNLSQAGVRDVVTVIKERSFNVEWGLPVSLLFIDALHDYANVRRDFDHFAAWLVPEGFVAFHDYADYYPGVKACVAELLAGGEYVVAGQKESLMVLQKQSCHEMQGTT